MGDKFPGWRLSAPLHQRLVNFRAQLCDKLRAKTLCHGRSHCQTVAHALLQIQERSMQQRGILPTPLRPGGNTFMVEAVHQERLRAVRQGGLLRSFQKGI